MQPQMNTRPLIGRVLRGFIAAGATIAIVGIIAALLVSTRGPAGGRAARASEPGTGTSTPVLGTSTPVLGTPGLQASHIAWAVTSSGVDAQGNPTGRTTTFRVGQPVYVAFHVQGISDGGSMPLVWILWYLDGKEIVAPEPLLETGSGCASVKLVFHQDGTACMETKYFAAGRAAARLYWIQDDMKPPNMCNDPVNGVCEGVSFSDNYLAWTLPFTMVGRQPSTTPAVTPTPTLPPTPTPTPSGYTGTFTQGVDVPNLPYSAEFWFAPAVNWTAGYVTLHYTVPGQTPQNVPMTYDASNGNWYFAAKGISSGQTITYSFTYQKGGLQYNTSTYTWTHP